MDLGTVVQQMRLDRLAVQASQCLAAAGVPHVLLKGPTTARWLYDRLRPYNDVDLLVPPESAKRAVLALADAGIARPAAGLLGEEASHSWLLVSADGFEVDLHVTLPMLGTSAMRARSGWALMAERVVDFELDGFSVPALDEAGRCLVVALHALGNRGADEKSLEDLRRARTMASEATWEKARTLSAELGVQPLLDAGLTLVEAGALPEDLPLDVRLRLEGRGGSFQLERLLGLAPREKVPALWRELFPSAGFMRYRQPALASRLALAAAYTVRLWRIARALPGAVSGRRSARKGT